MESWDDIRFFLSVAREGGLSAAAKELQVEPSTVHRRVGQLESELETKLFHRQARGYTLSSAGLELLASAEAMEKEAFTGRRRLLGRDQAYSGHVRVASAEDVASFLLPPMLLSFREKHPKIELSLVIANQLASLTRREADIAVRVGAAPKEDNVVAKRVCDIGLAFFSSEKYLKKRGKPRRMTDLANHSIIRPNDESPGLRGLRDLGRELIPESVESYRADSMAHLAHATAAGFGVALLPCFSAATFPTLVRLFKNPLPLSESVAMWVLVHHEVRRANRIRGLVDHLFESLVSERRLLEGRS